MEKEGEREMSIADVQARRIVPRLLRDNADLIENAAGFRFERADDPMWMTGGAVHFTDDETREDFSGIVYTVISRRSDTIKEIARAIEELLAR